jgi:hypothetical protein
MLISTLRVHSSDNKYALILPVAFTTQRLGSVCVRYLMEEAMP